MITNRKDGRKSCEAMTHEEKAREIIESTLRVAKNKVSTTDNQFLIWLAESIAEALASAEKKGREEAGR